VNVVELWTENSMFSMWMADGMASMNAARSVWGLGMASRVGSWWVAGCTALVFAVISITMGWVGGRDSWDGISSISVSLGIAGGSLGVFLVLGAIVHSNARVRKKGEN
jgi:hypothetical protein